MQTIIEIELLNKFGIAKGSNFNHSDSVILLLLMTAIETISIKNPTFDISELAKTSFETKETKWEHQTSRYKEYGKPSYSKYAGSYAQEYEGLSDDFIDSALDGCPDAYWNID